MMRRRGDMKGRRLLAGAALLLAALTCLASKAAAQPWKSNPGKGSSSNGNKWGNSGKSGKGGCDCNRIPLKPGPPVCGDDGIEYINSCLAECQGVTVVKSGRCPGK